MFKSLISTSETLQHQTPKRLLKFLGQSPLEIPSIFLITRTFKDISLSPLFNSSISATPIFYQLLFYLWWSSVLTYILFLKTPSLGSLHVQSLPYMLALLFPFSAQISRRCHRSRRVIFKYLNKSRILLIQISLCHIVLFICFISHINSQTMFWICHFTTLFSGTPSWLWWNFH